MENIAPLKEEAVAHNGARAMPCDIWKARNFIHEQADEPLSLTKVASAANVSANYLSEKFKRVTGENFVSYINRRRVEKALTLLLDPKLRISEIAFAVGFQSLSQFNRVFKKTVQQSPSELRAEIERKRNGVPADLSANLFP